MLPALFGNSSFLLPAFSQARPPKCRSLFPMSYNLFGMLSLPFLPAFWHSSGQTWVRLIVQASWMIGWFWIVCLPLEVWADSKQRLEDALVFSLVESIQKNNSRVELICVQEMPLTESWVVKNVSMELVVSQTELIWGKSLQHLHVEQSNLQYTTLEYLSKLIHRSIQNRMLCLLS